MPVSARSGVNRKPNATINSQHKSFIHSMAWQEEQKFTVSAKLDEVCDNHATISLLETGDKLRWPRAALPVSIKPGDEFFLQIVSEETRELTKASLRRDILSELIN